ncbi:glucosamine inositolphosphorylceramide transferase family protein [Leadbettera azotonutricia]|uniref:Glucosamine inositolphosphorylceramide transferase 1 N-terminal domain-containing protein n=1 Tax=Leadbettera azotonutricia (strain ATCC BAA-888 / DSM 13862 / ZAS-9) TaxID=545695 RepID=F5YAU8_LEAAZ|nr:hypothetical protein [Leadbettera azotonutricia]AEF82201.1 conserved hypothetical protein [Leadbettera azotonutricia ZAS-9]
MKPITLFRIKKKLLRTFFYEQWSLLVCDPDGNILKTIIPPINCQWADPFPVEYNGKTYIFIEQQLGSANGTLGVIELYPDLTISVLTPILEKNYHLSFPNVFCIREGNNDIWYMIPETHENNTIDLYQASDFPYKWDYTMTLMHNVIAVDSTVFYYNQKWWLFTNIETKPDPINKNLSAFYSNSFPSDTWTPHLQNPLVSNLENSRMAGTVFYNTQNRSPYRPAQNCLKDYGKETNINEIMELTPFSYKEKLINTYLPERNLHAVCTHTINYTDKYMLRDIKTRTFRGNLKK